MMDIEQLEQMIERIDAQLAEARTLAAALTQAVAQLASGRITAHSLTILNAAGAPVATLTSDSHGNGLLVVCDQHQIPEAVLHACIGGGVLRVLDGAGEPAATVQARGGRGEVSLFHGDTDRVKTIKAP